MTDLLSPQDNARLQERTPRLSELIDAPAPPPRIQPFGPATLLKMGILTALLLVLHAWQLPQIVGRWLHDLNWQHGFLIPLFSLYLLFARRQELLAAPRRVCWAGLPVMIFGILAQIVAFYPVGNYWLTGLCLPVIVFGVVLFLGGPAVARVTWLPIFFLALSIPLSARMYTAIALPLQEFAAFVSALLLKISGVGIELSASTLTIRSRSGLMLPLTVAEACSGIRSLMAFLAIGVAMAYLENRPPWQRVVLVLSTIPIAIACNVARVVITCTMFVIDQPQLGQKFMHEFLGMVMLIPALLMFWALGWLLRRLGRVWEETEDDETSEETART